jgi:hypothetical protein
MVKNREEPPQRSNVKRLPTPEETWIKGFLEFSGTDNVTRFYRADLRGVSLTKAVEAICQGDLIRSEKCDGPGSVCTFRHESEDGAVEVKVFFVASEMVLEIRGANAVKEVNGEPDAA